MTKKTTHLHHSLVVLLSIIGLSLSWSTQFARAQSSASDIGRSIGEDAQKEAKATFEDFLMNNNINFYNPDSQTQCAIEPMSQTSKGITQKGNGATGNRDYKGEPIIREEYMNTIKKNQSVYEEASKQTKVPWQIFAVLHLRESVLADFNPPNGQGIYQNSLAEGGPYPEGKVSDQEFLRQTVFAGERLVAMANEKGIMDLIEKGDPDAIKKLFFRYNGEADEYKDQAYRLGFKEGYEGSPYVMNFADEKRDPTVNTTGWGQIKRDYGRIEFPANGDHGAFVMYAALAGIPSTGGSSKCIGDRLGSRAGANGWETTGPNAMAVYYQDAPSPAVAFGKAVASAVGEFLGNSIDFSSKPYGVGTIKECGCGPTSMAMAAATLNLDASITPETMAKFYYENGYQYDGCGSDNAGVLSSDTALAKEFNLEFIQLGTDVTKAAEAVKRGSFVYISFNAGGYFGGPYGHLMLIRGVTDSGNFLFADPWKNWGGKGQDKTMNNEGFPASEFQSQIIYMVEVRSKKG